MILRTYWKPIAIGLFLVGVFGAGWKLRGNMCDARIKAMIIEQQAAIMEKQKQMDAISVGLESNLAKQRAATRSLTRSLQHEISKHSEYNSCKPTIDGLRQLNATINSGG